jgi:hypothetical protein
MKLSKESIIGYVKDAMPLWVKILPAVFIFGLSIALAYQYGESQYQRGRTDAEVMYLKTSTDLANRIREVEGTMLTQFREGRKGLRDMLSDNNAEIRSLIVDKECVSEDFKNEYNKRLKK